MLPFEQAVQNMTGRYRHKQCGRDYDQKAYME